MVGMIHLSREPFRQSCNFLFLKEMKRLFIFSFFILLELTAESVKAGGRLKLATTTSTANSGLIDHLNPVFEKQTGIRVDVISVGTGKALRLGKNGDVDVVLVHARSAEDRFVQAGFGVNRRDVMYNNFIIVGPASDPAGIRGFTRAKESLRRIFTRKALWFSRGDESGTNKKEMILWKQAGISPSGDWYRALGQGQGRTLIAADEKEAYTLSDRGTFIALSSKNRIDLEILTQGDPQLFNPYGVIAVNPERHPHVRYREAMQYIEFLTSANGQELIGRFLLNGEILFHPFPETGTISPGKSLTD